MYTAYFGLKGNPFSITPDPAYLYMSPHHQEALAHLLYGTGESGGFVQLTGEVGTGKTTLIRTLLEQRIEDVDVALCLNPRLTVEELVATICDELQVRYSASSSLKPLLDVLNQHLLKTHAQGRRTVLIIDEAQNLNRQVLEQVRLLTNLETHHHKLLRIILVGQPELQSLLARPDMRQLAQRITARYHLTPLSRMETGPYIIHRLKVAGGRDDLFTAGALKVVYRLSQGVPRLINVICDRALLGTYVQNRKQVDATILRRAAREALGPMATMAGWSFWIRWITASTMALILGLYLFHLYATSPLISVIPEATLSESSSSESKALIATSTSSDHTQTTPNIMALAQQTDAIERLLVAWKETIPPGTDPCEQVKSRKLRCLSGQGDWDELRLYNRPAILELTSSEGDSGQILLQALDSDTATLNTHEGPVRITTSELDTFWTGHYLLLWRLQTSRSLIRPGSQGESIRWLRRRLALAEGREVPPELSENFDSELKERVQRFQAIHDLDVDGLVGARTMVLLNQLAAAPNTPMLNTSSSPP